MNDTEETTACATEETAATNAATAIPQTLPLDNPSERASADTKPTIPATRRERAPRKRRENREAVETDRRLKIVVYAIARDESKFVKRWMDSMKEADAVVVLDTGSRDDTVEALRKAGAEVETQVFNPWRFDVARNASIDLAVKLHPDADLLVCTDIDEYFIAGWREKLERVWKAACRECRNKGLRAPTTAQYEYVWGFLADGSDGTKFWYEKIHTPQSVARWSHPVHEILEYPNGKLLVRIPEMRLEHHADPTKSRSQYLGLLEMSVREAPTDDRNMHYLGREYVFHRRWDDAIKTLQRHLALPTAKWDAERAASMRYIARCYGEKRDPLRQELWLWRAVYECANQREAALELAELFNATRNWPMLVRACELCLSRTTRVMTYLTKAEAWGSRPHDLYAIGLWRTGRRAESLAAIEKAVALAPNDARIAKNREIIAASLSDAKTEAS